jgi:hypothetical protein
MHTKSQNKATSSLFKMPDFFKNSGIVVAPGPLFGGQFFFFNDFKLQIYNLNGQGRHTNFNCTSHYIPSQYGSGRVYGLVGSPK